MSRLKVENLTVSFSTPEAEVLAVDDVSFDIESGTTLALVGESGAGKSVIARSTLGLLHSPPATIHGGRICIDDENLLAMTEKELRAIRGARIGMVFQDPLASLNPVHTIGYHVMESLLIHERMPRRKARQKAIGLLDQVGFPEPEQRIDHYPHELSGGMRQRVMIAAALACDPDILIADEPTTALDMVAARGILDLLNDLKEARSMTMLLISHDLGLVANLADSVAIMYSGRVIERGASSQVMTAPSHAYTQALLASLPPIRRSPRRRRDEALRLPVMDPEECFNPSVNNEGKA